MIKRRKPVGGSLLAAASVAGTTMVMASCVSGKEVVSGNLMPPPNINIELCIEVSPEEAVVTVTDSWGEREIADGTCDSVPDGTVQITATAEGYDDYAVELEIYEDTTHEIEMIPTAPEDGE